MISLVKATTIRTENILYHLNNDNPFDAAEKIKNSLDEIERLIVSIQLMENDNLTSDAVAYLRACHDVIKATRQKALRQALGNNEFQITQELEQLAESKRKLAGVLPKDVLINNILISGPLNRVKTLSGVLNISRSAREEFGRPDTLKLNDGSIFRKEMEFVSIEALYALSNKDVALISTHDGGSGTFSVYSLVILFKDKSPILIENNHFYTVDGTFAVELRDDNLIIDLGFIDGLHKIARLDQNNTFGIEEKKEVAAKPISDSNCQWLFDMVTG